jgi:hypothetical protein
MKKVTRIELLLGVAALALGTLVYLIDRPPGETALPDSVNVYGILPALFGAIGESLPAFTHVFAFSLLTAACLGNGRYVAVGACATWLLVDTAFELGQHPSLAPYVAVAVPEWFQQIPILGRTAGYFLNGTFDPWDLVAIFAGTLAAYATLTLITRRSSYHAPETRSAH